MPAETSPYCLKQIVDRMELAAMEIKTYVTHTYTKDRAKQRLLNKIDKHASEIQRAVGKLAELLEASTMDKGTEPFSEQRSRGNTSQEPAEQISGKMRGAENRGKHELIGNRLIKRA
jgi:hypothetical protein